MRVSIENENLKVEIESLGAELRSLIRKDIGEESMWEADPAFWEKTSPILFPFIGKLEGSAFLYNNGRYRADKHGFAKNMDFAVTAQEKDRVVFAIESTEETLEKYPFPFLLEVEYRLEGNSLTETIRVQNQGKETMHFSLGGHPAFACPPIRKGARNAKRTDCFVKLYGVDGKEVLYSERINKPTGLLTGERIPVAVEKGVFPISEHIFDKDALVFAEQGVTAVGFLDQNGEEFIRLEAESCPVWGIWSMADSEAAYVCIEPWWGICDRAGYEGNLEERPYTNHLEGGKVWGKGFKITVEG